MNRITDTSTDQKLVDVTETVRCLFGNTDKIIFTHWDDFSRVSEFIITDTGVNIFGNELFTRLVSMVTCLSE